MRKKRKANPNNVKYLKPIKKGEVRNPRGGIPLMLREITEELKSQGYERVGAHNVREAYELLFNMDEKKIKEVIVSPNYPMLLRIVAKEMMSGKGVLMLEMMMDRAHGKAKQEMEVKVEPVQSKVDLSKLSDEELKMYYELTSKASDRS